MTENASKVTADTFGAAYNYNKEINKRFKVWDVDIVWPSGRFYCTWITIITGLGHRYPPQVVGARG